MNCIYFIYSLKHPIRLHARKETRPELTDCLFLVTLAVRLGGIVTLVDDEVFGPVVFATGEVRVEDGLDASSVSLGPVLVGIFMDFEYRRTF